MCYFFSRNWKQKTDKSFETGIRIKDREKD